ncbi:MAG: T9SS type A sorting domain-containing protein [Chitinophagaceae bacterium]|nr:T9SS type A sorting domain-containing protein [Chitinophagaceae bacterium]
MTNGNYAALHLKPTNGNNYYRIKQIDANGKFTYSSIQMVKLADNFLISIYPNPATDIVNIVGWNNVKQMQLYDVSGQKVNEWLLAQPTINVNGYSKGVYVLKVELKTGKWIEQN